MTDYRSARATPEIRVLCGCGRLNPVTGNFCVMCGKQYATEMAGGIRVVADARVPHDCRYYLARDISRIL